MYRKYTIEDPEGKIELEVHPPNNLVKVIKHDIDITLPTRELLTNLIKVAGRFMSGNTITKVEIEEVE